MKAITPFGFGRVNLKEREFLTNRGSVAVALETPFLGNKLMDLTRDEVFIFSDWAAVRVLNITAHGLFSNLQFYESRASAEALLTAPVPPDETILFLDLQSGRFKINHRFGVLTKSIIIRPWVDRWAKEMTTPFELITNAREAFRKETKETAGTSGGIATVIHLDTEGRGNILGFCLTVPPPLGVVFQKEFALKI